MKHPRARAHRHAVSILLCWLTLHLTPAACLPPARAQLRVTVTPPEADGYFRIVEPSQLGRGIFFEIKKSGEHVLGGGHYHDLLRRMDKSAGLLCFRGVIRGNKLIFTRAVKVEGEISSHIGSLSGVDLSQAVVQRVGEAELDEKHQMYARCAEVNELFDDLKAAAEDDVDFEAIIKGVKAASDAGKNVLGITQAALKDYAKLKREAVNYIVFRVANAKTRAEMESAYAEARALRKKLEMPESVKSDGFARGIIKAIEGDDNATLASALDNAAYRQFRRRFAELPELERVPIIREITQRASHVLNELNEVEATFSTSLKVLKRIDVSMKVAEWVLSDNYLKTLVERLISVPVTNAALILSRQLVSPVVCFMFAGFSLAACTVVLALAAVIFAEGLTEEFVDALEIPRIESANFFELFVHRELPKLIDGNQ